MYVLKASRPGLWFQTIWLYVLPAAGSFMLNKPVWWLGLLYVTFPLNLLVYGWNDIVDEDIDAANPRKDSWLFGARLSHPQLRSLIPWMVAVQVPFLAAFVWLDGWRMLGLFAGIVAVNFTYNLPVKGLRGRPPFDLVNPIGYLLVVILGVWLNELSMPPTMAFVYLVLFCGHAQLMGEIMDVEPDRAAGRVTTATLIGTVPAKLAVIALLVVEGLILGLHFGDWVLGGALLGAVPALLIDLWLTGSKQYTRKQFTLLGVAMNAAGLVSMVWVWFNDSLG